MKNSQIKVLVGDHGSSAQDLGRLLISNGADVSYSHSDPLRIQFEVQRKKPDALILTDETRHTAELCTLLKKSDHAPYIVIISDRKENRHKDDCRDCADLIVDRGDRTFIDTLCSGIFRTHSAYFGYGAGSYAGLDELVAYTLFELCITKNYYGYEYLMQAILIASRSDVLSRSISKDIYPDIARKFGVKPSSVERNIRTAIHSAWSKSSKQVKSQYFGTFAADEQWVPTNSQFIYIIADRLMMKLASSRS